MANVSVYNMEGNEVGKMELNDAVFGVEINEHLVHMAVVAQLANKRQGTQKAKTRSEVSGGGRKPWRNRTCTSGFNQSSAVDRRRYRIRSDPERLHHHSEQEREESSIKVRSDQQSTGEQVHRC